MSSTTPLAPASKKSMPSLEPRSLATSSTPSSSQPLLHHTRSAPLMYGTSPFVAMASGRAPAAHSWPQQPDASDRVPSMLHLASTSESLAIDGAPKFATPTMLHHHHHHHHLHHHHHHLHHQRHDGSVSSHIGMSQPAAAVAGGGTDAATFAPPSSVSSQQQLAQETLLSRQSRESAAASAAVATSFGVSVHATSATPYPSYSTAHISLANLTPTVSPNNAALVATPGSAPRRSMQELYESGGGVIPSFIPASATPPSAPLVPDVSLPHEGERPQTVPTRGRGGKQRGRGGGGAQQQRAFVPGEPLMGMQRYDGSAASSPPPPPSSSDGAFVVPFRAVDGTSTATMLPGYAATSSAPPPPSVHSTFGDTLLPSGSGATGGGTVGYHKVMVMPNVVLARGGGGGGASPGVSSAVRPFYYEPVGYQKQGRDRSGHLPTSALHQLDHQPQQPVAPQLLPSGGPFAPVESASRTGSTPLSAKSTASGPQAFTDDSRVGHYSGAPAVVNYGIGMNSSSSGGGGSSSLAAHQSSRGHSHYSHGANPHQGYDPHPNTNNGSTSSSSSHHHRSSKVSEMAAGAGSRHHGGRSGGGHTTSTLYECQATPEMSVCEWSVTVGDFRPEIFGNIVSFVSATTPRVASTMVEVLTPSALLPCVQGGSSSAISAAPPSSTGSGGGTPLKRSAASQSPAPPTSILSLPLLSPAAAATKPVGASATVAATEPCAPLRAVWESLHSPYGTKVKLAFPVLLTPCKAPQDTVFYEPLLSAVHIHWAPWASAFSQSGNGGANCRSTPTHNHTFLGRNTPSVPGTGNGTPAAATAAGTDGLAVAPRACPAPSPPPAPFQREGTECELSMLVARSSNDGCSDRAAGGAADAGVGGSGPGIHTATGGTPGWWPPKPFIWYAPERPENRRPFLQQMEYLAATECPPLLEATTQDVLPTSWFSVLWQPIFCHNHSPARSCGSFLCFYAIRPSRHLLPKLLSEIHPEGAPAPPAALVREHVQWDSPILRTDAAVWGADYWSLAAAAATATATTASGVPGAGPTVEQPETPTCTATSTTLSGSVGASAFAAAGAGGYGGGGGATGPGACTFIPLVGLLAIRPRWEVWFMQNDLNRTKHAFHVPLFLTAAALQLHRVTRDLAAATNSAATIADALSSTTSPLASLAVAPRGGPGANVTLGGAVNSSTNNLSGVLSSSAGSGSPVGATDLASLWAATSRPPSVTICPSSATNFVDLMNVLRHERSLQDFARIY